VAQQVGAELGPRLDDLEREAGHARADGRLRVAEALDPLEVVPGVVVARRREELCEEGDDLFTRGHRVAPEPLRGQRQDVEQHARFHVQRSVSVAFGTSAPSRVSCSVITWKPATSSPFEYGACGA